MSLNCLLEAARIVEQRHGNDITSSYLATSSDRNKDVGKFMKRSPTYRATHNQLEKNRRKHLRDCLHALRDLVPSSSDTSKVTTLNLLQSATEYIKVLENDDRHAQSVKRRLYIEQQRLRKKLTTLLEPYSNKGQHKLANSKVLTSTTTSSCDVENDDDTGYGSNDDALSTGSNTSVNSVL